MNKREAAEILGVSEKATEDTIKKAYKRKAKQYHPDAGGQREDFERARVAMDILLDNETMQCPSQGMNDFMQAAQKVLTQCDPVTTDIIASIKECINQNIAGIKAGITQYQRCIDYGEEVLSRSTCNRGYDVIKAMIEQSTAHAKQTITQMERAIVGLEEAIEIADGYEYRYENKGAPTWPAMWTTTT